MNWLEQIEEKRTVLVGGLITICLAALAVTARRDVVSFDIFWHIQAGIDWLAHGLSPWKDHFSYTFQGQEIQNPPYMFQAAVAWLTQQFGLEPGVQIFRFLNFVLVFSLFTLFLRKLKSPTVVYCLLLPMIVVLLQLRATTRPELLSYSLSIVAVILYHRARGQLNSRNMIGITALMFFWSNYHSPIYGYIIFFGLFLDIAIRQFEQKASVRDWIQWLLWGGLIFLVGFLNPGLSHPVLPILFFSNEWKDFIQEYQSAALYVSVSAMYGLILLAALTLVLSAWQKRYGYLLVTLILIYFSVTMARLVTPSGLVILGLLASLLAEKEAWAQFSRLGEKTWKAAGLVTILIVVLSLSSGVSIARSYMQENKTSSVIRPELLVDYMEASGSEGKIFNEYEIGGYLIYRLSPSSTVYLDGRTGILYPVEHYQRYLDARNNSEIFRSEVEKFGINHAILRSDQRAYTVMHDAGMQLDYVDARFSLFTYDGGNYPKLGELIARPMCWKPGDLDPLETEHIDAVLNLPSNSTMFPFSSLAVSYSKAEDKKKFLVELGTMPLEDPLQIRFAAYQALAQGMHKEAFDFFEKIEIWDLNEFLAASLANIRLGNWAKAEEVMDWARSVVWPQVEDVQIVLAYNILATIDENWDMKIIPESYVQEMKTAAEGVESITLDTNSEFDQLCLY